MELIHEINLLAWLIHHYHMFTVAQHDQIIEYWDLMGSSRELASIYTIGFVIRGCLILEG
jgi:hypothetical protein